MKNLEHISPDFRYVMALSDAERISFMEQPRWINYPAAQNIISVLKEAMDSPVHPRMKNFLIVGEPFNGKTTLVQKFYDLFGTSYIDENSNPVKPILLTESPPKANEKELYISILERFFVPYRYGDPCTKLRYQVLHLFRSCKIRMLILDEFHSLLEGTGRQQREIMNCLKFLCNELNIPIVGVGTRSAVRALHTDPQHASRFDVIPLPLWKQDKKFQSLLKGFERILPLRKPSDLFDSRPAGLLFSISGGNIGDLHHVLKECAKEAIMTGEEHISMKIIEGKRKWQRPSSGIREIIV